MLYRFSGFRIRTDGRALTVTVDTELSDYTSRFDNGTENYWAAREKPGRGHDHTADSTFKFVYCTPECQLTCKYTSSVCYLVHLRE